MSEEVPKFIDASNFQKILNLRNYKITIEKSIYVYKGLGDDGHVYKIKKFRIDNVPKNKVFSAELKIEEMIEEYKKGLDPER